MEISKLQWPDLCKKLINNLTSYLNALGILRIYFSTIFGLESTENPSLMTVRQFLNTDGLEESQYSIQTGKKV